MMPSFTKQQKQILVLSLITGFIIGVAFSSYKMRANALPDGYIEYKAAELRTKLRAACEAGKYVLVPLDSDDPSEIRCLTREELLETDITFDAIPKGE